MPENVRRESAGGTSQEFRLKVKNILTSESDPYKGIAGNRARLFFLFLSCLGEEDDMLPRQRFDGLDVLE